MNPLRMTGAAALTVALAGLAACSAGTRSGLPPIFTPSSAPSGLSSGTLNATAAPQATDPSGQTCAQLDSQGYCPGDDPAPTPSSATGPLGSSFTVTTTDSNGNQVVYEVTLTQVDQHAGLQPYETLNNPADHLVAARFTVKGVTGQASDDIYSDAVAIGDDTTTYDTTFEGTSDGGDFNSGVWSVGPGQTESGWVAFEVPGGHKVAQVVWQPQSFGGGATGTWTVS